MTIFSFHFMIKLWKRLCTKYYFCIYGSESTVMTLFDVRDTHEWNRAANKFLLGKFLFLFENAKATSYTQSSLHKHTKKSNDIHVIALMRFSVDLSPRLSVLQISNIASIAIPCWNQFGTSYPKQNRRTTYRIEDWLNYTRLIQSFKSLKATINPLGVTGKQTHKDTDETWHVCTGGWFDLHFICAGCGRGNYFESKVFITDIIAGGFALRATKHAIMIRNSDAVFITALSLWVNNTESLPWIKPFCGYEEIMNIWKNQEPQGSTV